MAKIRDKAYVLNREKYKATRNMIINRWKIFVPASMSLVTGPVMKQAAKPLRRRISKNIVSNIRIDTINEVLQAAAQVKGIGPKKLEEISAILEAGHEKI